MLYKVYKNNNKKGFTLVELLAVIVVLAIVMSLAVVAITNVLDTTRKNSFVADARSFLEGAHNLVSGDAASSFFGSEAGEYAPSCSVAAGGTKFIPIDSINLERGGTRSPYGNQYQKGSGGPVADAPASGSFVKVVSTVDKDTNDCTYAYSIYLTDGVYSIGSKDEPIAEAQVTTDKVKVGS